MRLILTVGVLLVGVLYSPLPTADAASTRYVPLAEVADASTIKQAISAHRGHVVVVNFWATWCVPCVAEFPALVRLQNRYASRGVVVMSVSADQGKQYIGRVQPFLTGHKADFPSFILKPGDQQAEIDAFDPTWEGDLPRTFIYDRRGRLVKTLTEPETYAGFVKAVKPLL